MLRLSESIRTTFSAHFNLPISVSLYSQLSSTVPCCTRVKNTSRKLYILTFLQKLSRCERGTLTHFENKVDFKATHKFTRVNNIHNVSLVSSEQGYEYYQTVSDASYFFKWFSLNCFWLVRNIYVPSWFSSSETVCFWASEIFKFIQLACDASENYQIYFLQTALSSNYFWCQKHSCFKFIFLFLTR